MRPASAHILPVLLALSCLLAGCAHRGRVIPEEKFTRIYRDMFLADQWIRDHPQARIVADTTLFFDPILKRYGYSFEDYDRSVHYYLDHPEKYSKILTNASERLHRENERLEKVQQEKHAAEAERDRLHLIYKTDWDFADDSLRWAQDRILWPVREAPADTLAAPADSTAAADTLLVPGALAVPKTLDTLKSPDAPARPVPRARQNTAPARNKPPKSLKISQ